VIGIRGPLKGSFGGKEHWWFYWGPQQVSLEEGVNVVVGPFQHSAIAAPDQMDLFPISLGSKPKVVCHQSFCMWHLVIFRRKCWLCSRFWF
jgi:hypothetical protein